MKINNKNKIVKNNSLSFIYNGIKKQSLSFLIIILFINILLPFNVFFNNLEGVSLEKNTVAAETTLEAAQKKLEEAKANLNKINLIIADLVEQIEIAKSKNQNTTQLENNLTVINRDVWAAANSEVIAAQKEVTREEILAAAADGAVTVTPQTEDTSSDDSKVYKLLAPIGKLTQAPTDIGSYFNTIFNIALGLCAVLAVIMIVIGGVQYMGDESIFGKTEAKDRITKAIFGLLIALGSYALLNTINPDLLGGRGVTIKSVSAEIAGDTDAPIGGVNSLPSGIICSGGKTNIPVIVNSFSGKMTYQMGAKGVPGPNNTIKLDCSGFVNYVLKCAGVPFVNGGTASIFSGAEKVTSTNGTLVNGKDLALGDLVGWKAGENKEKYGHVMIYVGNGNVQVADSHGGSTVGKALGIFSISKYKDRIKYIKRAS